MYEFHMFIIYDWSSRWANILYNFEWTSNKDKKNTRGKMISTCVDQIYVHVLDDYMIRSTSNKFKQAMM